MNGEPDFTIMIREILYNEEYMIPDLNPEIRFYDKSLSILKR